MDKYIGHIKGRGYFNGIRTIRHSSRRTDSEQTAYLARNPSASSQFRWYVYYEAKPIFKRNISDIINAYIFDTKEQYDTYIDDIKSDTDLAENGLDMSIINEIVLEKYSKDKREKRVIPSKKGNYYSRGILNLSLTSSTNQVVCGHCGTNIYEDEYRMNTPYTVICIHCLESLGRDIKDAYDKTPESYKDDWLLARSVDI